MDNEVPSLPKREDEWHPMVVEWWESVWRSPMAGEYLDADVKGGLYLLADLHQARWNARDDPKALREIAGEIRLQEVRYGLSPIDRSRLRWEVDRGESADARTDSRRKAKQPAQPSEKNDPRNVLKLA